MRISRSGNRRRVAAMVVAAVVLVAVLLIGRPNPKKTPSSSGDNPDVCVAAMIAAEKAGDVESYLNCFTGSLRDQLQSRMAAKSRNLQASQLRRGAADLTGHAITELEFAGSDAAKLVLERIYTKHNERHEIHLRRVSGGWKIIRLTPLERFAPEIPYGTPVVPLPEAKQR